MTGNNEKQALAMNGTINLENRKKNKLNKQFNEKGSSDVHAVLGEVSVRWSKSQIFDYPI